MRQPWRKQILSLAGARLLYRVAFRLGGLFFDLDAFDETPDARIFEYSFVIERLSRLSTGRALDVGCTSRGNLLPAALAALGWQVHGIDRREFKLSYPNFHFIQGELTSMPFPDGCFDAAYAVSTIEHIGLSGRYGIRKDDDQADFKAVAEMRRVLKPGGSLLVTVPYGRSCVIKGWARIYDAGRLQQLFGGWYVRDQRYFFRQQNGRFRVFPLKEPEPIADFEANEATALLEVSPEVNYPAYG